MAMNADKIKELKSMITKAKTDAVNIGVCFGKKPAGVEIVMDKIRKPETLGREAKAAGETVKVAIGTFSVSGTAAAFKVEGDAPTGLGKHLKKFFALNDISVMSVEIIGADGKVIIEKDDKGDGEEAGGTAGALGNAGAGVTRTSGADAGQGGNAGREKDAGQAPGATDQPTNPQPTNPEPTTNEPVAKPVDPKDLVRRLGAIKPQLAGLPEALGERLNGMFHAAVEQVKTGVLAAAATGIGQLEAALAKIDAARQQATASQTQGSETPPGPDPKLAGLSQAVEALRAQVNASAAGVGHDAMIDVLDQVVEQIAAREAEKAMAGLKRVQDGLKLQAEVDRLAPIVAKAASGGRVADVNALNNLFNMVADAVPATDHAKAMANLGRVEAMIAEGTSKEKSTFEAEVPPDVKPFATARLNWMFTRRSLKDELSKLEATIAKALDEAGLAGNVKVDGALTSYIDELDTRLENKLAEIVNSNDGADREKLKAEARDLIDDYNDVLERDFFKDVDNANGFMPVAVTSTAQSMLKDLSRVLA